MGAGAQGSTTAMRLDEEEAVAEIRCTGRDRKALDDLAGRLGKARGFLVDAWQAAEIAETARLRITAHRCVKTRL